MEAFSFEFLATITGATLVVTLITQLVKGKLPAWVPTRLFAYVIALVSMLVGSYFTVGLTLGTAILAAFNAVIATGAAIGLWSATIQPGEVAKAASLQNMDEGVQ